MIKSCSWSILKGLSLDESVSDYTLKTLPQFPSNGVLNYKNVIYYLPIIENARETAVKLLRKQIEQYMTQCIDEHEQMLKNAREDWKTCK